MYPVFDPSAYDAMIIPSIIECGSYCIRQRSLKLPGSLSSALQTTYFGFGESFGTNDHFIPVGNPAPPRPRSALFLTSSIMSAGAILSAFFKLSYPPVSRYTFSVCPFSMCTRFSCNGSQPIALISIGLLTRIQNLVHFRHGKVLVI